MSGKIVNLVPPGSVKRSRDFSSREPFKNQIAIATPVRLCDADVGGHRPDVSWVWKISATVTLGMIALSLLVVSVFFLGTSYESYGASSRDANNLKSASAEPPVVIVQPSNSPPSLPETSSPVTPTRSEIISPRNREPNSATPHSVPDGSVNAKRQPEAVARATGKPSPLIGTTVEGASVPNAKVVVNMLEINHADGETTVHKIGKVEKFKPKEGINNVQE
jgi:hypothetical protein